MCFIVGDLGVIKGWEERTLNMSKAVKYNKEQGTFTVERAGVYFLFCQVTFCWGTGIFKTATTNSSYISLCTFNKALCSVLSFTHTA